MQIIPVIDLKDGQVVHAVRGERAHYQPIHLSSRLAVNSDIETVLKAFGRIYPFQRFYIADLNAICGEGNHQPLIEDLLGQYPDIEFWIDNACQFDALEKLASNNLKTVIGTESQLSPPSRIQQDFILSLDYQHERETGDAAWFTNSRFWPQRVIAMTLNRVGSNSGPDFDKLAELSTTHARHSFIAAGGIRHAEDLFRLAEMGIEAALLSTALHSGAITNEDIAKLRAKKYPGKPRYFSQPL